MNFLWLFFVIDYKNKRQKLPNLTTGCCYLVQTEAKIKKVMMMQYTTQTECSKFTECKLY